MNFTFLSDEQALIAPASFNILLQCYTLLEDCHIVEASLLGLYLLSGSNCEYILEQFLGKHFHRHILYQTTCVKVDPVVLVASQSGVTGNLYGRNWRSKRRSSSGCK